MHLMDAQAGWTDVAVWVGYQIVSMRSWGTFEREPAARQSQ